MESIWAQTCEIKAREPLHGNAETEIAVIGAGMAGLLIAHMLQEAGFRTLVLEADRIAGGQTRNTTAKITSQHGLFYHKLIQTMGTSSARAYAAANEAAIAEFRRLIQERSIDCEFEELRAYLYGSDREALQAEAESASSLGLPATFVDAPSLPFPVSGAVCFDGQAQFHPLKFLKALSAELTIYEKTRVSHVEENRILTDRGIVTAEKILFACHYPFVNFPGMYIYLLQYDTS
ncbi:MAG: FAD-binding oxidoreductase [Clostridia bacterium]|nr:FAD-binding oxidoreductase [Clostridia bacterium]